MSFGKKSKVHHWWPIGIQKQYWADANGSVNWITPAGKLGSKKNYKHIGMKFHGHTRAIDSPFQTNFETKFDCADNNVHNVIKGLQSISPSPLTLRDNFKTFISALMGRFCLRNQCHYSFIGSELHRQSLLVINSLLIRSPAKRYQFEHFRKRFDKDCPPCEEVGKGNMLKAISAANKLYAEGKLESQFFVILHSDSGDFVYGDGMFDELTNDLFLGVPVINGTRARPSISGKALVTLTPNICVYFSTPKLATNKINCASLKADKWMIDSVNELTQIYSRDRIFYKGNMPKITPAFSMNDFGALNDRDDPLIGILDGVAMGG